MECLTARLVGYGTNDVPNPPYIDGGTVSFPVKQTVLK
jgi:hypothetical protein